ncbi:SRPBCC family protein [Cupriavidus sp. H18C1]
MQEHAGTHIHAKPSALAHLAPTTILSPTTDPSAGMPDHHSSLVLARRRPRGAPLAALAALATLTIAPAAQAQLVPVERSILIHRTPELVWSQAGDYCAIAKWDTALRSCSVVLGDGSPGTVRRAERKNGGPPVVDVLVDRGPYSYVYRKLSNHTRGRLQVSPGPDAGTAVVTWQMWLDPLSVPAGPRAEYPQALGDEMQKGLGRIKVLAEQPVDAAPAYPVRESTDAARPSTQGS